MLTVFKAFGVVAVFSFVIAPLVAMVCLIVLFVSKLSVFPSFVPMVIAAPVVLPPFSISPPPAAFIVMFPEVPVSDTFVPAVTVNPVPLLLVTVRGELVPLMAKLEGLPVKDAGILLST